ncbi:MAG: 2,4-dihydroxyhept-2-ene-1,7-dioic acid aldolase [Burkholderiales bacterium]|nr:2,4-dihydroxyhept-2-ene-1,7-dioic acid aldolase [Burkholderiales bacterium]
MLLKQKLARGDVATMINPDHPSPSLVEFIGGLGFDAVFIDCEHGMAGPERVQEMCRAARLAGVVPVVRPEANRPWLITRYLDAGAGGVMVPHIDTADAARELVEAVRYTRHGDPGATLVVGMVESRQALDNLDAILDVEGIDVYFVGPGDLSKSLDLHGQRFHPTVRALVVEAARRIVARGKIAGTLVKRDNATVYVEAGFRFLYEHANALLADGAQRFSAALAR